MGTDIHAYLELFVEELNKFILVSEVNLPRDYDVFSLLSGIRNCYKCEFLNTFERFNNNKAFSPSIHDNYRFEDYDYHTPGILDFEVIKEYKYWNTEFLDSRDNKLRTPYFTVFENSAYYTIFEMLKTNKDLRLIFCYDN